MITVFIGNIRINRETNSSFGMRASLDQLPKWTSNCKFCRLHEAILYARKADQQPATDFLRLLLVMDAD